MKKTTVAIILAAGLAVTAACTAATGTVEPPAGVTTSTTVTTPAATVANFEIDLLVNSSECFGSAGGLYSVETDLSTDLDDPGDGRLIYQINGGEDGPVIDSISFSGRDYRANTHVISTSRCGTIPTVQITGLR